jgi:hypothetical protein
MPIPANVQHAACVLITHLDNLHLLNDELELYGDHHGELLFQWACYRLSCSIRARHVGVDIVVTDEVEQHWFTLVEDAVPVLASMLRPYDRVALD